eukprot:403360266
MKLTVLFFSTYFLLINLSSTTNLSTDKAKQLLQDENLINLNHEQFWEKENLKRVGQTFTTMSITSDQFGILIGNYIVQLLNEEYLYNLNDCAYYAYQIGDLGIKAVTKVTNGFDLWGSFMNIMTIVHKEPETVRQCLQLKESWNEMFNAYNWITAKSITDTVVSYASNILFNWADLIDEAYWITVSYLFQDWEYMGKLIAKLTSDLFLKSPIRNSFNYRNSQFLKYRLYRESSTTTVNNANSQSQILQSEELIDRVNKCVVKHKFGNRSERQEFLDIYSMAQDSTTPVVPSTTTEDEFVTGNTEIYDGLVLGVGRGTIAVCVFGIFGLVICFFKDMTATPSFMVAAGIALPLLVLLIVWFLPKESLKTETEQTEKQITDNFRVRTGIFSALIFLICLFMSLIMCGAKLTTQLTGQKVDSELAQIQPKKSAVAQAAMKTAALQQQQQSYNQDKQQEGRMGINEDDDEERLPLKDDQEDGLRMVDGQNIGPGLGLVEDNDFNNRNISQRQNQQQYDEEDPNGFNFEDDEDPGRVF